MATISTSLIFTNSTRLHSTRNSLQSPGITPLAWHLLHSPGTQVASQNMRSQPASALMSYRARPLHSTHNFHFGVQNMILHNLCSGYRTTQYDWTEKMSCAFTKWLTLQQSLTTRVLSSCGLRRGIDPTAPSLLPLPSHNSASCRGWAPGSVDSGHTPGTPSPRGKLGRAKERHTQIPR